VNTRSVVPWAGLRPMMPDMLPRVGRGNSPCVFYNTGHGHLGWTLSAVTADMIGGVVEQALGSNAPVASVIPLTKAGAAL
jgi:D-amino-acid dehydrogenase